jgi:hypothetical protein
VKGVVLIGGDKGGVRRGMVTTKVKDAANDAEDGTELWVTTAVESNDFSTDAVFLVSEGQRYKSRRL